MPFNREKAKYVAGGINPRDSLKTTVAAITDSSGGSPSSTIPAATNTTALTHAFGTADNTVEDVTVVFDQTILNNNFKEITTELATQRTLNTLLINAIASLAAKSNNGIAELESIGLTKAS